MKKPCRALSTERPTWRPRIRATLVPGILCTMLLALLLIPRPAQAQGVRVQIPDELPAMAGAWDVAIDDKGNMYVSAFGDRQVVKLSAKGEELMRVTLPDGGYPMGIDLDDAGNIYVADWGYGTVRKLDASGNLVATFGSAYEARGLAVDGLGHVYLGDRTGKEVHVYTTSGVFLETVEIAGTVAALAIDDADDIYVLHSGNVLKFDRSWNLLSSFRSGAYGEPDSFASSGFDVDASGHVYLSDYWSRELKVFAPDGTFLGHVGSAGSADGQFAIPSGVAIARGGDIYVTDASQGRVQHFRPSGGFVASYGAFGTRDGQFDTPIVAALDDAGNIHVVDRSGRIQTFDADGTLLSSRIVADPNSIRAMAIDGNGNTYLAGIHSVGSVGYSRFHKLDSDGGVLWSRDAHADAIAVDGMNNVYLGDWDSVEKYDPDGNLLFSFSDPSLTRVEDIAVDVAGNIYVSGYLLVHKYDASGNLLGVVANVEARIDTDSVGNLYLADVFGPSISVLDPAGALLYSFGEAGGGRGQLAFVSDIAVTVPGLVYVADESNHRVLGFLVCLEGDDGDGDGICNDVDQCPDEDPAGYDADDDGCRDTLAGLRNVIDDLAGSEEIHRRAAWVSGIRIGVAERSVATGRMRAATRQLRILERRVTAWRGSLISEAGADLVAAYAGNVAATLLE